MHVRKLGAAITLALGGLIVGAQVAGAAPIDDKRAQATRLQRQIEANGSRISALAEQHNGARYRLNQTNAALADAQRNLAAAESRAGQIRTALAGRAAELLKLNAAGANLAGDDIDLSQLETAGQRAKYAQLTSDRDRTSLNQLAYVREDLAVKRKTLSDLQAQRKSEADAIAKSEAALRKANAEQQRTLNSVNAEVRALMAEQQRQQRRTVGAASGGAYNGPWAPNVSAPNGTARAAIAFAQAQLGKPYVYAASGPGSYDCSGLTMAAYDAAGVGMPHYSGAQFSSFPHVPLDNLLPGDLVFWGPGGGNHVGLYVGGGMMIHAPYTGTVVQVAPIHNNPVGAVRPWA